MNALKTLVATLFASASTLTLAIPTLQVGAPGTGCPLDCYANYSTSLTNPTESDTAVTSGGVLYFAGVYGPNTALLGGKHSAGDDWGTVNSNYAVFNGHRAIVMASVAEGASGTLTLNGASAFLTSDTAIFPNNHRGGDPQDGRRVGGGRTFGPLRS